MGLVPSSQLWDSDKPQVRTLTPTGSFWPGWLFIYFWLSWVFVAACRLSQLQQWGYLLHCAGFSLLASLFAEHGLFSSLRHTGSIVVAHKHLVAPKHVWNLSEPGIELVSWHGRADSYLLDHQGSPPLLLFGLVVSFDLTHTKSQTSSR